MICACYDNKVCSAIGETVEEVRSKLLDKGHLPGKYVFWLCDMEPTRFVKPVKYKIVDTMAPKLRFRKCLGTAIKQAA